VCVPCSTAAALGSASPLLALLELLLVLRVWGVEDCGVCTTTKSPSMESLRASSASPGLASGARGC
jgi:hypothetical protein